MRPQSTVARVEPYYSDPSNVIIPRGCILGADATHRPFPPVPLSLGHRSIVSTLELVFKLRSIAHWSNGLCRNLFMTLSLCLIRNDIDSIWLHRASLERSDARILISCRCKNLNLVPSCTSRARLRHAIIFKNLSYRGGHLRALAFFNVS